jgi:hypothetical protein
LNVQKKSGSEDEAGQQRASHPQRTGRRMRAAGSWTVIAAVLFLASFSAQAEEGNIHLGQLHIHPYVSVGETFSDNVYYTDTDEKRDTIITYTPGIKLDLPVGRQLVEAEYYAVANRYRTYPGEDTTDHHASGLMDFKIGSPFELRLSDVFTKGHEPRSSSATGFIEVFRNNIATASASYQLPGRSKVQFDAGKSTWDFIQSPFRDRDEKFAAGYLYYRFLPKTSAFLEFDRRKVVFDDATLNLDSIVDSELAGLTWEITEKSKGTIKAGRMQKDFESPVFRDFRGWISSVDLRHAFSEDTSLIIVGQRTVNETNVFGTAFFVTTGAYGEFTQRLFRKLAVVARGSYGKDVFSNPIPPDTIIREDKTAMAGGGLKFDLWDWFELGADYNYRTRNSNIPVDDYREHEYVISASAAF